MSVLQFACFTLVRWMLQTTHSFNAANGSGECSAITTVQQIELPNRFLGHDGVSHVETFDTYVGVIIG